MENILIIGPGKAGNALKRTLIRFQKLEAVMTGRGDKSALIHDTDLIFITTPDAAIADVVSELLQFDLKGRSVVHLSGTEISNVLSPLKKCGAQIASMHPMKAITSETEDLSGIYFDLEGDEDLCTGLSEMISSWHSKSIRVTPEQKKRLHIASVMVSNYLVTLMDAALGLLTPDQEDQQRFKDALVPLMLSSVKNLQTMSPAEALTGPIQRGDIEVLSEHIRMLSSTPDTLDMYRHLALRTIDITSLDEGRKDKMRNELS